MDIIAVVQERLPADTAVEERSEPISWALIGRVVAKGTVLFLLLNGLFAAAQPLEELGRLSLYNRLWPGRERLPYGEIPAEDYNLTLNNVPAMFAAHALGRPKESDEFRVLLIGDSGTWGWYLNNDDTLAGQLNAMNLETADGRHVVVYNLGYPVMSLTKDLLLLDEAMAYDPDLVLWPVTLQSFARGRQLQHPLLQNNAPRVRSLIRAHDLNLDPDDERFVGRSLLEETVTGRRRDLADLLRLQALGLPWTTTGIDQAIPKEIPLRSTDLEPDESWLDLDTERPLTAADLALDVLAAGMQLSAEIPVVLINEPMFVSDGANSDVRYNTFYPRWAYDRYRDILGEAAATAGWRYLDLWDAIAPDEFADTPVHLTPDGTRQYAALLAGALGWR